MDTPDIVSAPAHYADYKIEPKDFIIENNMEFWRGNIIKYASRAGKKDYRGMTPEESEVLDLQKAYQYCMFRICQIQEA